MGGEDAGARNVEIVKAIHRAFKQAGPEAVRAALIEARTFAVRAVEAEGG